MVVELVPVKGGIGSIFHPPRFGKDYTWYIPVAIISCQLEDGLCHRPPHLLREPKTTIDLTVLGGS